MSRRKERRHSLPDYSELSTPRLSRIEEERTSNSTPRRTGKTDTLSSENTPSSKELLREIKEYCRKTRKQLTFEPDNTNQTPTNSDASTSEQVQINVLRETVIAEVHQTQTTQETASVGLKHKAVSFESVVAFPRKLLARNIADLRYLRNNPTLRLISVSKPVHQYSDEFRPVNIKPLRPEENAPPSPAPADPHQESLLNIEGNRIFSNNVILQIPTIPPQIRDIDREVRTPEPVEPDFDGEDIFCAARRREVLRYRDHSARTYLELSPEFDDTEVHQLPLERLRRAVPERISERRPPPAQPIESPERISHSQYSSPRRTRDRSPSPSTYRYCALSPEIEPMGRMNSVEDHERKIIIEFCHLLEKSKQLFNGLRELPQYGHKQWHSYFGRTFDVYTKLWKFQQQHRAILDSKYGLKRWQIGEIASKIGQLYYHFYQRTSETAYLNEAYSFYYAIRGRSYYTQACKEDKCELMVKKLRYYARFIVACLLLKKVKLVKDLIKELDKQIVEYGNAYQPDDQNEWRIVADEVRAFIKAEPVVAVIHPDDYAVMLSHRLNPQSTPPVDRSSVMNLTLQEALIIGSNSAQVKFSELTMDMFRMMQTLEREPSGDIQHMYDESPRQRYISTPSAVNSKGYSLEPGLCNRGESPHKYLLFKPSPNQIFVYLASAVDDLAPNGVVLLYISAEGLIIPPLKHPEEGGYDVGGLITTSTTTTKDGKSIPKYKDTLVMYPGDIYPFTRRPMFIIVDSDNSCAFNDLPRHFGQPLVILMSPVEQPASLHTTSGDKRAEGSLFTLFLHCPLSAFCYCCDIKMKSLSHWERAQSMIDSYLAEASQILIRSRIDSVHILFMGDDFLRLLILRFIFCETFLRMHRLFRGRTQRTRVSPPLPDDLYEHSNLTQIVINLASHLQVRGHFHDPSAAAPAQSSNRE